MIYCLLVAFIADIPLSHSLMAKKAGKVEICHVNSANDVLGPFVFGRVIEMSSNALNAHWKHGDSTHYLPLTKAMRDSLEKCFGIALPNANCVIIPGGGAVL